MEQTAKEMEVSKGTEMEEIVEANFKGECTEVGMYMAMPGWLKERGYLKRVIL